ncbi:type I secretion C-terminal target domain-containing protein, partial [Rhodoferax sp.]|uniref:type I secretion C-terminal target domain-containing protein n=1 Tax=Rhodoferax sp. TaxID=50421 RepID=UPI001A0540EF
GGAGADGGISFVQLLRIVEGVEPLVYEYDYTAPELAPDLQSAPLLPPEEEVAPPAPVTVSQALLVEEESVPANGGVIGNDEDDGLSHTDTGSVWSGGASGVVTTITIAGFAPVTVAAGGSTVFFDQAGNPIQSGSEATAAAQLTVNPDGIYTFTMLGAMSHEPVQGENTLVLPLVVLSGTASDGAPTTVNLSLSVMDDVPSLLAPSATHIIELDASQSVTAALNFMAGSDGVGSVNFTFTQGTVAMDADGNALSFNGQPLYLHYGQTGGVIDYSILVATTSSTVSSAGVSNTGTNVGFWIDIDPTANTYTLHSNGVIENGTAVTATTLSSVGGGNQALQVISDIGGTTQDVVLTTKANSTVNTSSQSIGISTGQSFKPGEDSIRLDFTNGNVSGQGANEEYKYESHNTTTAFRQQVGLTGNASSAAIKLSAILADTYSVFYGDALGESPIPITGVRVFSGTLAQVNAGTANDVTDKVKVIYNDDGTVEISGIQNGWFYEVTTTYPFSALQVDALSSDGAGNFKLGVFSYGEASDGTPIELNYGIVGTDGDGDAINGSIDVTMYPAGPTIVGTNGGETLEGTTGTDYLLAGDGNYTLIGGEGDDILIGGEGDDILIGGEGDDTLTGGAGADVFKWSLADQGTNDDPAIDTIKDFTLGLGGDQLDLRDILDQAEDPVTLDAYLHFVEDGGNVVISVDTNGLEADGVTQTIILEGVTFAEINALPVTVTGTFTDEQWLIAKLLQNDNLKTDM